MPKRREKGKSLFVDTYSVKEEEKEASRRSTGSFSGRGLWAMVFVLYCRGNRRMKLTPFLFALYRGELL